MYATRLTSTAGSTPVSDIRATVATARGQFASGRTRAHTWRLRQLEGIIRFLDERKDGLLSALREDLGKPESEALSCEIEYVRDEAERARRRLANWMKPRRISVPLRAMPGSASMIPEPLGLVLVVSPWSHPVQLSLAPLASAVAAGNAVILKPSEVAATTSAFISRHLTDYLDSDAIAVVEGGKIEAGALLAERFDHIYFAGGARAGRDVLRAAAEHLTPVSLNLGGKCTCIVDRSADLRVAARRIVWGKFINAGQSCLAPNHVLVHETVEEALVERLAEAVLELYGEDPRSSRDFGRIINRHHVLRLAELLEGDHRIVVGGIVAPEDRYVAPTVLQDVDERSSLIEEEIFGPILPVLPVADVDAAIDAVNAQPKAPAVYAFAGDRVVQQEIVERTSSGTTVLNHTALQLTVPDLPVDGVGDSGSGTYRGKAGFEAFSHLKGVVQKPVRLDIDLAVPRFRTGRRSWLTRFL